MTDEKKKRGSAEGERLNLQVIGCINNQLARLPDARTKARILAYVSNQIEDEAKLERANALSQQPFPVNGAKLRQPALFDNLDE